MEEWKEYKLGEIFDFNNGLSKGGKFFGHGYDFVSFKTVFKNHFLPNTLDDLVDSSKKERENRDRRIDNKVKVVTTMSLR